MSTIVASATTEITPATSEPTAQPCLGGGNVVSWPRMGSYGGKVGGMSQTRTSGRFEAVVRGIDYIEAEQSEYSVRTDDGSFALRVPGLEGVPIGEVVHGDIHFPGACSGSEGDFVIVEHEEGERMSPLVARASRLTIAWRAECRSGHSVLAELQGCAHFDARNPDIPE